MNKKTIFLVGIIIIAIMAGYSLINLKTPTTEITISGAFALYPLMIEWTEEYQAVNPGVKFSVSAGGAGKGMTDALTKIVDIGMVSREIYPEEESKGAFYVGVAIDAVVITMNDKNPVYEDIRRMGLTKEQLSSIFILGETSTWGELVNRSEVTQPIHVYTRSDACGAAVSFAQYMGYHQEDLLGVGVYGDPGLLEAVKTDEFSIGYNNVNYVYEISTGLPIEGIFVVPLDIDGDKVISPNEDFYSHRETIIEAIKEGRYPSPPSRELYLVTKDRFEGEVYEFIRWILVEGQDKADEAGFISLSPERVQKELEKLNK